MAIKYSKYTTTHTWKNLLPDMEQVTYGAGHLVTTTFVQQK